MQYCHEKQMVGFGRFRVTSTVDTWTVTTTTNGHFYHSILHFYTHTAFYPALGTWLVTTHALSFLLDTTASSHVYRLTDKTSSNAIETLLTF